MSKKFESVPTEKDTKILFRKELQIGNYDVLYEKWNWEGIRAESFIFSNGDILGLTAEKLKQEVCKSEIVKDNQNITLKRSGEFTFINFNFETT